jgi:hypothetical protein
MTDVFGIQLYDIQLSGIHIFTLREVHVCLQFDKDDRNNCRKYRNGEKLRKMEWQRKKVIPWVL